MFCHQQPCGLTQLSSEGPTIVGGGVGRGGSMEGVWRLPALSTVAFVGTDWWLWEPPSLYKSVFASQVFVQSSADFPYIQPCADESERPGQRQCWE